MYGPLSSILLDYIPTIFNPLNNHWCSTAMEPGFLDEHQLEARMGAPSKNQAFSMNFKKKSGWFHPQFPIFGLGFASGSPKIDKNRTYALIRFPKWWMFYIIEIFLLSMTLDLPLGSCWPLTWVGTMSATSHPLRPCQWQEDWVTNRWWAQNSYRDEALNKGYSQISGVDCGLKLLLPKLQQKINGHHGELIWGTW